MASLQITFHNLDRSAAAEEQVRRRYEELTAFSDRITACRVVVDVAHRHQRRGRHYQVRVELTLPGGPIVVNHDAGDEHAHDTLNVAIRDTFDAARRRLQDLLRRLNGDVKTHASRGGEPQVPIASEA